VPTSSPPLRVTSQSRCRSSRGYPSRTASSGAGVVVAALDSACGYAALTLMPADAEVLSVEFKVNLLAPASGDRLFAEGEVVRAGRTLTVCRGDAYAEQEAERVHVATMLATMVRRRAG
jgi:uncharacterized protein (TIGR00369 family)